MAPRSFGSLVGLVAAEEPSVIHAIADLVPKGRNKLVNLCHGSQRTAEVLGFAMLERSADIVREFLEFTAGGFGKIRVPRDIDPMCHTGRTKEGSPRA